MTTEDNKPGDREDAKRKLVSYIIEQIKQSVPETTIVSNLAETSIAEDDARALVQIVRQQMIKEVEKEQLSTRPLLVAMLAAGVASIVGGLWWGLIVKLTEYEIGFMATGIGLLSGFAVVLFSNRRGLVLQFIAVVSALVGIGIGKYLSFFAVLKDFLILEYGEAAVQGLSTFSSEVMRIFLTTAGSMFSPYDVLWIVLAVIAAWRIPRGLGIPSAQLAKT